MKALFFDDIGAPHLWVVIAGLFAGIALLMAPLIYLDNQQTESRYAQCMRDRNDLYFCDSWAHRRAVVEVKR